MNLTFRARQNFSDGGLRVRGIYAERLCTTRDRSRRIVGRDPLAHRANPQPATCNPQLVTYNGRSGAHPYRSIFPRSIKELIDGLKFRG